MVEAPHLTLGVEEIRRDHSQYYQPPKERQSKDEPPQTDPNQEPSPKTPAKPIEPPRLTIQANAFMEQEGIIDRPKKPTRLADAALAEASRLTPGKQISQFICAVVGESHRNGDGSSRQVIIERYVSPGDTAELRREPKNPHDPSAVAVFVHGYQIGYLKRDVAGRLADLIDDPAYRADAVIENVYGGTPGKPSRGVTLDLQVLETGIPSITASVEGIPVWKLVKIYKDDLAKMLKCCEAEESAFYARPDGRRFAASPGAFLRAAILSRKAKDFAQEVDICRRWLDIQEFHDSQPIVAKEGWELLRDDRSSKAISARLEKAEDLMNSQ